MSINAYLRLLTSLFSEVMYYDKFMPNLHKEIAMEIYFSQMSHLVTQSTWCAYCECEYQWKLSAGFT